MTLDSRVAYLRQHLQRSLSTDVIDPVELTYEQIARASSTLTEYWELTRKDEYTRALELNPQERSRRKEQYETSKAASLIQRSLKNALTKGELAQFEKNLASTLAAFPVFLDCPQNGEIVARAIAARRVNFLDESQLAQLIVDLISTGSVYINPAALGAKYAAKYGEDELPPGNQRILADDLRVFTTPKRPLTERETINALSADEFYRHPEYGEPLRHERNRHNDQAVQEQELKHAHAAVSFILAANRDLARSDANRDRLMNWLRERGMTITRDGLQQAVDDLNRRGALELTAEHCQEYGASRFLDFGDLRDMQRTELPAMHQSVEIVTSKTKKYTAAQIHAMDAATYAENMKNPEFVQAVEELLANEN